MGCANDRSVDESWKLYREACRHIPRGTQTNSKAPLAVLEGIEPCFIVKGEGCRLWDLDGNEYLDFRCALGPITLGYGYPDMVDAVREQLKHGAVFSCPNPIELEVAKALIEVIPGAQMVRFLKTGGEAMAAALKTARAFTGKDIVLRSGYHGWLSTTGEPGVPESVNRLFPAFSYGDLEGLKQLVTEHSGSIAAISVAPAYARLGPGDKFLAKVRQVADRAGALLIFDEIVTGFRVAIGGVQEYYGVTPDLAVFSKGMANGMPVSALVGRSDVMKTLEKTTVSSTFGGDALSLAAARAVIRVYREEKVVEHIWRLGTQFVEGANRIFTECSLPIRYVGLPCCPQLVFQSEDPEQNKRLTHRLLAGLLSRGVIIYHVTYVNFSHTEADVAEALDRLVKVVTEDMI